MKKIIAVAIGLLFLSRPAFAQIARTSEALMPTGAVMAFALNNCPAGWLKADGRSVLKSKYTYLSNAMGTIHGNGSTNPSGLSADSGCPHASNCMNLPDYRGRFLRMIDDTAGNDADKASRVAMASGGSAGNLVGSVQTDDFKSHNHTTLMYAQGLQAGNGIPQTTATPPTGGTTTTNNTGGTETRPKNAYIIYCVKY